ncbi:enoyl-CoA hydratase [Gordonia sp. DT218]|uniref:enoyl-CoA hydratase n=1 Tax=Gordonia sp. DT218 TaxID=3416659 RepID=UPI003CF3F099
MQTDAGTGIHAVSLGRDQMRRLCALLLVAAIVSLSWLGTGTASAEPQLPKIVLSTLNFGTFGDHDYCHGALNVGAVAPRGKSGVVRVTVTSFGFTGNGPGWKRNPKCRFLLYMSQISGSAIAGKEFFYPVGFGPRPGEKVVREIRAGPGPVSMSVATYALDKPVRVPQTYGGSGFLTVVP